MKPEQLSAIASLRQIPNRAPQGVYFLMRGHEIIYIGQSINPLGRVLTHHYSYDTAWYVPIAPDMFDDLALHISGWSGMRSWDHERVALNVAEGALIRAFKPAKNGMNKGNTMRAPTRSRIDETVILERIGVKTT